MGKLIDFLDDSIQDYLGEAGMAVKPAFYLSTTGVEGADSAYFSNTSKGKDFVPSEESKLEDRVKFDSKDEAAKFLADIEAKTVADGKEFNKSMYKIEKGKLESDQEAPDAAKGKKVE